LIDRTDGKAGGGSKRIFLSMSRDQTAATTEQQVRGFIRDSLVQPAFAEGNAFSCASRAGCSGAEIPRRIARCALARPDRRARSCPDRPRGIASISAGGGGARDGRDSRETRLNADVFSRRRLAVFDRTTSDRRDWARPQVADLQDARGRNGKLPRASRNGRERLLNRSS